MSVLRNVEYGLMVKGVGRVERLRRASEVLDTVRLVGYEDRKPGELSGGQQQRVALARALVNHPKVLLLDEPLGALDLKLREEMQVELKLIQQRVGITFVYVTHDQGEALSMSDRVVVFNAGRIEQVGRPREIYEQPASEFVAGFVGITNLFRGAIADRLVGRPGVFMVRPEHVKICAEGTAGAVEATITSVQYLGAECRVRCRTEFGETIVASCPSAAASDVSADNIICLRWEIRDVIQIRL